MRVHRNAKTTPKMRLLIVTRAQQGWTYARIAEALGHQRAHRGEVGLRGRSGEDLGGRLVAAAPATAAHGLRAGAAIVTLRRRRAHRLADQHGVAACPDRRSLGCSRAPV